MARSRTPSDLFGLCPACFLRSAACVCKALPTAQTALRVVVLRHASERWSTTNTARLDVLPCGPLPPNPAEILHTERFANLVKQLEERYDRIIFDSPPVHAVTDAVILSQQVDGVVLVAKASQTAKEAIRRAARKLYDVKAVILGVVLNDLDFEEGGYGYYYYYHRYGYVYGESAADKKQ